MRTELLSCGKGSAETGPDQPAAKPNVLIIYADDLGYGEVKALNPQRCRLETPWIDSLARDGMIFTDGHSSSAVCTPSCAGTVRS